MNRFSFAEIRDSLANMHGVTDDKKTAFSSRIKNLQRKKFLTDLNTGRGVAADYTWDHLLQFGLIFELLEVGMIPERAIEFAGSHKDDFIEAVKRVCVPGVTQPESKEFFFVVLDGLSDLRKKPFFSKQIEVVIKLEELQSYFKKPLDSPIALIDLDTYTVRLYNAVSLVTRMSKDELSDNFVSWAKEYNQ